MPLTMLMTFHLILNLYVQSFFSFAVICMLQIDSVHHRLTSQREQMAFLIALTDKYLLLTD
jgi:hypothetical protein